MSPTRHVTLGTRALLRLEPKDASDRWHALFLESGLLTTVPSEPARGSPLELLRDARERLLGLQALEGELRDASAPTGGFGNRVPSWAYVVALAIPVLAAQLTRLGEIPEEEQLWFARGLLIGGLTAVIGLGFVGFLEYRARTQRKERTAALGARIAPLAASLGPAAKAVLSRSFVARAGPRLVVSTPHLEWLHSSAAAVRRGTGVRATTAMELQDLLGQLEAEAALVEQARDRLLHQPPDDWSDDGLVPDLAPYRTRLAALGVRPNPLGAALEEAWG